MNEILARHGAAGLRIGIGVSRFNAEIGDRLLKSCLETLERQGVHGSDITLVRVPGALELPPALQRLAQSGRFNALIALGAVVRGETYHFEIVSDQSAAGLMQVQLDTGVPVANGVLTTENDDQAFARCTAKGADCALVAIELANLMTDIAERSK